MSLRWKLTFRENTDRFSVFSLLSKTLYLKYKYP
nr:MAG TPA: hypothetical protein [Bacteriophage sp.]